jgi:hypothetical protein
MVCSVSVCRVADVATGAAWAWAMQSWAILKGNYRPSKVKPAEYGQWSGAATRLDLCWAYALQKKLCSVCIRADCDLQKMLRGHGQCGPGLLQWNVGQVPGQFWSSTGSILVKYWVNPGQVLQWNVGQVLGQFWSSTGSTLVKCYSGTLVKYRVNSGQVLGQPWSSVTVECWSNTGSILFKFWSNSGQVIRRLLEQGQRSRAATRFGRCWAYALQWKRCSVRV